MIEAVCFYRTLFWLSCLPGRCLPWPRRQWNNLSIGLHLFEIGSAHVFPVSNLSFSSSWVKRGNFLFFVKSESHFNLKAIVSLARAQFRWQPSPPPLWYQVKWWRLPPLSVKEPFQSFWLERNAGSTKKPNFTVLSLKNALHFQMLHQQEWNPPHKAQAKANKVPN